jgi:multiple sugar transport system substrate-binding protein
VNVAFSAYNDEFAEAAAAKTRSAFVDAVAAMQRITSDDLVKSGFSVG